MLAANSGVMPQTREHIILAKQIGLRKLVVFLNKADLVDEPTMELCEDEIREMLSDHGFDGDETPVIAGSAKMALEEEREQRRDSSCDQNEIVPNNQINHSLGKNSILKLLSTMDEYLDLPSRRNDLPSLMPITTIYSIPGRGTVASGILQSGTLKKGDAVDVIGDSFKGYFVIRVHLRMKIAWYIYLI